MAPLSRRLAGFDLARALCVFDFDGTLAPIVERPAEAAMRVGTRRALIDVARARPVAVLSGRARRDLLPRLRGVPLRHLIGSHGAEWAGWRPGEAEKARLRGWSRGLREALRDAEGVVLEDKGWSIAVHYRRATRPVRAMKLVLAAVERVAPDADLTGGKCVVNLGLPGLDKASALRRLRALYPKRPCLFVGDDENDERAFAAHVPGVLGIRVGPRRGSAADFALADQREVDDLLQLIRTS